MTTNRVELPPLIGGIVLALAGVGLAAAHIPAPDYLTNGAVLLLGIAGGATVPGLRGTSSSSSTTPSSTTPALAVSGHELTTAIATLIHRSAKPQVAPPTSTPTPAPLAAPGPAQDAGTAP